MQRQPPQPLPRIPRTEEIVLTAHRLKAEKQTLIDNSVDIANACFKNVARPLADLENKHSDEEVIIYALRYAAPEKETQHAVEAAEKVWQELSAEINKRTDFYALLRAVKDSAETLDYESQKT